MIDCQEQKTQIQASLDEVKNMIQKERYINVKQREKDKALKEQEKDR